MPKKKIIRYTESIETFSSTHFIIERDDLDSRLSIYLTDKLSQGVEMNTIDEVVHFVIQTISDISLNLDNKN